MSSLSDKQKQYGIIRVSCGRKRGTAFRVSDGTLLTARHIVEEYFLHHMPVLVYYDDIPEQYDAVSVDATELMVDVALLTPTVEGQVYSHIDNLEEELPLLSIDYRYAIDMHLTIVGYPEELGEGASQIEIKVRNHSEIKNKKYDVLTVREDFFELRMYIGFSGAPVVTESGNVIGVVSTETYGKLGYCSVNHIYDKLSSRGLKGISTDWETNDETLLSRKYCKENIEETIALAGSRYHRDNHQKDDRLMAIIDSFCIYKKFDDAGKKLAKVEKVIAETHMIRKTIPSGYVYEDGDYDNLLGYIDMLLAYPENVGHVELLLRKLKRIVELNYPRYILGTRKYLRIAGVAGTGKTHFSCYIAEYLQGKAYPYLLFGSQFNTSESILSQLSKLLPFGGKSKDNLKANLKQLDERMKQTAQNAVLIIDALNEGAGEFFWKDSLRLLTETITRLGLERVKLIVTIREPFVNRITSALKDTEWEKYELKGFVSVKSINKAIQSYFAEYGIDESLVKGFKQQFRNPLFLIIFCQSFGYLTEEERKKINRITLYQRYLKARNVGVAEIVSEDDKRNITWATMDKLAKSSVEKYHSDVVPREEARNISDEVCRRELWQHNLLNALLKENLLMETLSADDQDMVMFEFENIGDVLKANAILESDMSELAIVDLLKETASYLKQNSLPAAKFENMVTALIAMWDKERDVTDIDEFMLGDFRPMLIRTTKEYATEGNGKKIQKWLDDNKSEFEPLNLLQNIKDSSTDLFNQFDLFLSKMTMSERDEEWTVMVNNFYEENTSWSDMERYLNGDGMTLARLLLISVWMLTTSFPDTRQFLIRLIYRLLMKNESQVLYLINNFSGCDDHYLLTGLYCAIYGFTLRTNNHRLVSEVANEVKKKYYSNEENRVVADIELRQWTLMILNRAEYLTPSITYFSDLHLPFKSSLPTKRMLKKEISENYFGEGKGTMQLYYSLTISSDFYRYVIGGNSTGESSEFFEIDEKGELKPLKLESYLRMIAYIIKHDYRYTKALDNYDANIYSRDRHHNKIERIGKKYQWLALWKIYAQMSDNYWFNSDYLFGDPNKLTRVAWPWQTHRYDRNDPTMPTFKEMEESAKGLKFVQEHYTVYVDMENGREWVDSEATHPVINTEYIDVNGEKWVLLYGYQSDKKAVNKENRDSLLHYNCCFVREQDTSKMTEWATETDFSGRWMEHRADCIDFRWNEFPWSYAYKQLRRDEWVTGNGKNDYPCAVKVAYDEQLQEQVYGMVEERDYHSFSAGMPCAELVETMNLYTAERGLIRRMDNDDIIAVSLSVLKEAGTGLLIKKDVLCSFMKQKNYNLFCYISGTKEIATGNFMVLYSKNISGCTMMNAKGKWNMVQELRLPENFSIVSEEDVRDIVRKYKPKKE